jgi:hypothetical protein
MTILHEACVVTLVEQDDPWRTERRSSGWMVGDALPVESDTLQLAEDPWRTGRPRSDWNVGDTACDGTDAMQLALVPVASGQTPLEGRDAIVAGALTQRRITELLLSDDGSPRSDQVAASDPDRRALA